MNQGRYDIALRDTGGGRGAKGGRRGKARRAGTFRYVALGNLVEVKRESYLTCAGLPTRTRVFAREGALSLARAREGMKIY